MEIIEDGWSSMPLIEEGMEQAKIIGEYLKEKQDEYKLEKIISSDLLRAQQTADISLDRPEQLSADLC